MTTFTTTMRTTGWDETPGHGPDAPLPRLATADVAFAYEGDLTGTSTGRYVLAYGADGAGEGRGYETVTGRVGADEGTLVLRHAARFTTEGVAAEVTVVDASGGLAGLRGGGRFEATHGTEGWPLVLDLDR